MQDSEHNEILLGSLLKSKLWIHDNDLKPLWVIDVTPMTITMIHREQGAQPITLDQSQLDNSQWVVTGHIKIEDEKDGKK